MTQRPSLTTRSRMRRHGQQIECPHCGHVSRVGHLAWSALKCTACKAYVEKVEWIDVTSEIEGFMEASWSRSFRLRRHQIDPYLFTDGFSYLGYSPAGWANAIRMLLHRGFSLEATRAIMTSKWTRWASDGTDHAGLRTERDLARFLDSGRGIQPDNPDVAALVQEQRRYPVVQCVHCGSFHTPNPPAIVSSSTGDGNGLAEVLPGPRVQDYDVRGRAPRILHGPDEAGR